MSRPTALGSISAPSIRVRSHQLVRWGEVTRPVLTPAARKMDSENAAIEPLPLVPATRTLENSWSCPPRRSRSARVRASLRGWRATAAAAVRTFGERPYSQRTALWYAGLAIDESGSIPGEYTPRMVLV